MRRQVNDISSHLHNYYRIIISLKNIMWSVETGQVAQQQKLHCQFFWHKIKIWCQVNDSPGLIRGRLEPQRGQSLTVRAVCDGTLRCKYPPFNSILVLPSATHQDLTPK